MDGLIFNSKDSKELVYYILQLLEDENLQKNLGFNARKKIENNFDWEKIIEKFEIFYEKLR